MLLDSMSSESGWWFCICIHGVS